MGVAADYGSAYLLYYIGASAAFFIAPALLGPLSRVALTHKLGSLADIFAFRYPAPWVGGLVAVLMLLGVLPLIALQIDAVANTIHLLNQNLGKNILAMIFCAIMMVFAILFGARHLSTRQKHQGLVVAMGIESIIKLIVAVGVAIFAVSSVFGGVGEMTNWVSENRISLEGTERSLSDGQSRVLLLMFFAGAVAMPHVYHMLLTENSDDRVLAGARWGMPTYFIALSLCIPLILWSAIRLGADTPPEFYILGIGLASGNEAVTALAFLGGLAAASGVLIVTTLALASMTLNHIVLPLYRPSIGVDIYWLLLNGRRLLIAAILLGSYSMYTLIREDQTLVALGTVAFAAVLQFLPGLVGTFHWRKANKAGLFAGLTAGYLVWISMLFLPWVSGTLSDVITSIPLFYAVEIPWWQLAATASIAVNTFSFILFSMLYRPSTDELDAADLCMSDTIVRRYQGELKATSVSGIKDSLAPALGDAASQQEVRLALAELNLDEDERRPHALNQIRAQMESNLSSMMGQTVAHRIIGRFLPYRSEPDLSVPEHVHSVEDRLEEYRSRLTGLAAELDRLRRYHRQILQDLPAAVCTIGADNRVLTWNQAMTEVTGLSAEKVVGSTAESLEHWGTLLGRFARDTRTFRSKSDLKIGHQSRLLNLQKATVGDDDKSRGDVVIVVEDITEAEMLEQQLHHKERLASIGQLAAGVAHEIGNPVTGIACLAQDMKMGASQDELKSLSDQILEQTQRISAIVESLVNFAHRGYRDVQQPVRIDIRQCVDEAISLLSLSRKEDSVVFDNRCKPHIFVAGDPQRLSQVFVNILSNARDASKWGDTISIRAENASDVVSIEIVDQGQGITSERLKQVFEPFYTTKDPGQGTGLGLAIVNSIIEEHHGSILVDSQGDRAGTRVLINLPASKEG